LLISRGIVDGILANCRELGIGITAYGVLSRGLISGLSAANFRAALMSSLISCAERNGRMLSNLPDGLEAVGASLQRVMVYQGFMRAGALRNG